VEFTIKISLIGDHLTYEMSALPDRATPINLAQHSYYNLTGKASCRDHVLWLDAGNHTPSDITGIPTGQTVASAGTRYDFSTPRTLNAADPQQHGLDINMIVNPQRDITAPLATVTAGTRRLLLRSNQPGLQVYDASHITRATAGHSGCEYRRFAGLALEPQALPNALNTPEIGSLIATPDRPYRQVTSVEITHI
jgi:aldose 1-epimerase